MPEIVLPWKGKDTGFTLTDIKVHCNCGLPLASVKGNIYEMCGVIEMRTIGFCHRCRCIVSGRCRVYPKTGVFAQERNGKWEEAKMITFKQKWFRESVRTLTLAFGGLGFGIALTILCAKPTTQTFIWWGVIAVIFLAVGILAGYIAARRK